MPVHSKPPVVVPAPPTVRVVHVEQPSVSVSLAQEATSKMPENVTISADQFQQINTKLATLEAAAAQAESARQAAEARRLIESGQAEAVLKAHRDQLSAADDRAKKQAVTHAIMSSLSSVRLVDESAADQLASLLSTRLTADVTPEGGFSVRTPSYQPASDYIKETLAREDYRHFLASNQPATPGTRPGQTAAPAQPVTPAEPQTLGEQVMAAHIARKAAQAAVNVDPFRVRDADGNRVVIPAFGLKPLGR